MASLLMVFAKAPVVGQVKTRLTPALGAEGACRLHEQLVEDTLSRFSSLEGVHKQLWLTEPSHPFWSTQGWPKREQKGDDLGARMAYGFGQASAAGYDRTLVVGSDCPALSCKVVEKALAALKDEDCVIVPATDGGYMLLGLRRACSRVFEGIDWGSPKVLAQTEERLAEMGFAYSLLAPLNDIDEPADLDALPERFKSEFV